MNTIQMYDAQADSINIEDIATNDNNRIILRRMKRNNPDDDVLYIQNLHDQDGEACEDYVPEGAHDMGWLGYFIGKNDQLRQLSLSAFTPTSGASMTEVLEPFFMGVNNNKSIRELNFEGIDPLGGRIFTMLGPFFENCSLTLIESHLGDVGSRLLALAIGSSKHKSLKTVALIGSDISDEGSVDIITALSMHSNLKQLDIIGNSLSTKGCTALSTLLRCSATRLRKLYLTNNEINDEGIDALVPVLKNCSHLQTLVLSNNLAVSLRGWQKLASILEAPNCNNLEELFIGIGRNAVDDEVLTFFTNALVNNISLVKLNLNGYQQITPKGWQILTDLLCNTSSVNSTFLSNHALSCITGGVPINMNTDQINTTSHLLILNQRINKREVSTIKILQYHNDINMTPFFEWEFKVLPLIVDWLERASSIIMPDFVPNIGPKKLSSIYQFVRGMPVEYVETRLKKELEDIKEELPKLDQRKLLLEERKRSIMDRLGQRQ